MSPSRTRHVRVLLATACLALGAALPAFANRTAISAICDSAASHAARETGVPIDVLRAISLTETGRKTDGRFAPWPWTVNMEGIGKWFDDLSSAQAYVDRHFARGARSFDVGCFQINYKWHGRAFASVEEMFDPMTNARYAARFLAELHDEFGDWSKAAGAYHSRTPKFARRYTARFDRIRANLSSDADTVPTPIARTPPESEQREVARSRTNNYPFLAASDTVRGPSLVPLRGPGLSLFAVRDAVPLVEVR